MKFYKGFFILFLVINTLKAQDSYDLIKSEPNSIIIDGKINKEEWKNAKIVDLDLEIEPSYNTKANVKTTGYITYSDNYLFVAFYAYGNPSNIRSAIRQRDDYGMWNDDVVLIKFDTYRDARNNILLASNPFGSQYDVKGIDALTDEERYDGSFNINYESSGTIVEDGYNVEMKIPFSSLPFPSGTNQKWHFNMFRKYYDENSNEIGLSNERRDRDNPCEICQVTKLLILNNINIEKKIELLPYVSGNFVGDYETNTNSLKYSKPSGNAGIGLNLDITKNTSIEVTINPDFSQVEADVTQIDINSAYALLYPEKRPFFNRGSDLVKFSDGAFYSRSINNPIFSSKLLSQGKNTRIFFLTALDKNSPYQIAGNDRSYFGQGNQSIVNVFRYQRILKNNNKIGLFSSSRYYKNGGYGNLFGLDGLFQFSKIWKFSFEVFKNFNEEPINDWIETDDVFNNKTVNLDGEKFNGDAIYLKLLRNTEHWVSMIEYKNLSPGYRTDVGFVVKNDRRWLTLVQGYKNIINKKNIQSYGFGFKGDFLYNFENELKVISIDLISEAKTIGNTDITYTYDLDVFKNYEGKDYKMLPKNEINIRSQTSEFFSFFLKVSLGKDIAYNEDDPQIGKELSFFSMLSFQINDNFNLTPSLGYSRLKKISISENYFKGYIARLSGRYQFTKSISFRIISEYNDFQKKLLIQPLFQWNPNPFTIFYIGGNQNALREEINDEFGSLYMDNSQFFIKFQYLISL
jgi:hypothetical protein